MKKIKKFQREYRSKSMYETTASEERLYWLTVEFQSLESELDELIDLHQQGNLKLSDAWTLINTARVLKAASSELLHCLVKENIEKGNENGMEME